MEQKRGVAGSLAAQEQLEHVSMAKSEVDKTKGETLDDISSMVERITATIASKKTALAPLIKELRVMRSEYQELEVSLHRGRTTSFMQPSLLH